MIRSELIQNLSDKHSHLPGNDVELAVKVILDTLTESIVKGERVEVRGFGSFCLHSHKAKQARNPKTGEKVLVSAKNTVHFKPGKELKKRVNDSRKN